MKKESRNKTKKHKLKISDIKKYSSVDIGHTVEKIKMHEREMTIITVGIMTILILIIGFFTFSSFDKIDKANIYKDKYLTVKYFEYDDVFSDVITLGEDDVLLDENGLESKAYKFSVSNHSKKKVKYEIILKVDDEMVELDNCYDLFVNDNAIKYSFNDKINDLYDTKEEIEYVLEEDFLDAGEVKNYNLKIWINKDDILDKNNNHFHGNITVKTIKKY